MQDAASFCITEVCQKRPVEEGGQVEEEERTDGASQKKPDDVWPERKQIFLYMFGPSKFCLGKVGRNVWRVVFFVMDEERATEKMKAAKSVCDSLRRFFFSIHTGGFLMDRRGKRRKKRRPWMHCTSVRFPFICGKKFDIHTIMKLLLKNYWEGKKVYLRYLSNWFLFLQLIGQSHVTYVHTMKDHKKNTFFFAIRCNINGSTVCLPVSRCFAFCVNSYLIVFSGSPIRLRKLHLESPRDASSVDAQTHKCRLRHRKSERRGGGSEKREDNSRPTRANVGR